MIGALGEPTNNDQVLNWGSRTCQVKSLQVKWVEVLSSRHFIRYALIQLPVPCSVAFGDEGHKIDVTGRIGLAPADQMKGPEGHARV